MSIIDLSLARAGLLDALREPAGGCTGVSYPCVEHRVPGHWCDYCIAWEDWRDALPLARAALADLLEEEGWPGEGWEALALACLPDGHRRRDGVSVLTATLTPEGERWLEVWLTHDSPPWSWEARRGWFWAGMPTLSFPPLVRAAVEAAALAALRGES